MLVCARGERCGVWAASGGGSRGVSGRGVVEDLCFVRVKCDAHSSALGYRLHFKMCVALCICMGLHGASCYMRGGSLAAHIFSGALVHHVCSGSAAYRVSSSVMGRNGAVRVVLLGWDGMRKGRGKGRRGTGTRTMATGKRRGCGASGLYYSRVYSVSTVHSVVWALEHANICFIQRAFRQFVRRILLVASKICRRKRGSGGNRAWLAIGCRKAL